MTRGGYREGSGRKSSWNHPDTQLIRVPRIFAALLLHIARRLDQGETLETISGTDFSGTDFSSTDFSGTDFSSTDSETSSNPASNPDSVTESYNQDTLNRIAQEIISNESIVSAQIPIQSTARRVLTAFIDRLLMH